MANSGRKRNGSSEVSNRDQRTSFIEIVDARKRPEAESPSLRLPTGAQTSVRRHRMMAISPPRRACDGGLL
jgi:hypothetical protein